MDEIERLSGGKIAENTKICPQTETEHDEFSYDSHLRYIFWIPMEWMY